MFGIDSFLLILYTYTDKMVSYHIPIKFLVTYPVESLDTEGSGGGVPTRVNHL